MFICSLNILTCCPRSPVLYSDCHNLRNGVRALWYWFAVPNSVLCRHDKLEREETNFLHSCHAPYAVQCSTECCTNWLNVRKQFTEHWRCCTLSSSVLTGIHCRDHGFKTARFHAEMQKSAFSRQRYITAASKSKSPASRERQTLWISSIARIVLRRNLHQ